MEETDEGPTTKAAASGSAADAKPDADLSIKAREEGEVSSSDDDENPGSPVSQSAATDAPSVGTICALPIKNYTQSAMMAKAFSGNNRYSSVDIPPRTSVRPNNQRIFDKNRLTFKSGNPGRLTPSRADDNLVISFSDDDSGSDSDVSGKEKGCRIKSSATVSEGSGQPAASSVLRSNKFRQTAPNVNKSISTNLPSSRPFISSVTKIGRGVNSRKAGPQAVDSRFPTRNCNNGSRNFGAQEGLGLKNSKLQDLRQQIALRESELKLKAAQQKKDPVAVSLGNHRAMNLSKETARKRPQSTSASVGGLGGLGQKEADSKRLKVSGSYSQQLVSDSQQEIPSAKSDLPGKEPTPDNQSLYNRNRVDHSPLEIPKSVESGFIKQLKQDDRGVDPRPEDAPSAVRNVSEANTSCSQSDRDSRQLDHHAIFDQSTPPVKTMFGSLPKSSDKMELSNQRKSSGRTEEQNLAKSRDYGKDIAGDKTVQPMFNNISQVNDASLWNCWDNLNVAGHGNLDIQSVFDMEELLDKELEQAQECRRMCEIEERNALKAYRRAQRDLIQANARCDELYRRRELYSANFRSFMMEDPNFLWSSRLREPAENGLSNPISEIMGMVPASSHLMQPGYDGFSQRRYESNIHCDKGAPLSVSFQHPNRQNLDSEPGSELDASTSDPLPHKRKNAMNGLSSPSNDLNVSADEDEEMFPLDHEAVQPDTVYQQKEQLPESRQMRTNDESNKNMATISSQDPLLLEATLRSELFARLKTRTSTKNVGGCYNVEQSIERGPNCDIGNDKTQFSNDSDSSSGEGQFHQQDNGGADKPDRNMLDPPLPNQVQCHVEESSLKLHPPANSVGNEISIRAHPSTTSLLFSPPLAFRSAFDHLKVRPTIVLSDQIGDQQNLHNYYCEERSCVDSKETLYGYIPLHPKQGNFDGYWGRDIGSYNSHPAVDPFWPFCMYELRGKCNNDECPWQHVKDLSSGNLQPLDNSDHADSQAGLTMYHQNHDGLTKDSKCHNILTPPLYMVGLDVLRVNPHTYEPVVTRRPGECWKKCFTISLALSSMCHNGLPAAFSCTGDGRIEVHGTRGRNSSFLQSKTGVMNQFKQASLDAVKSVEMAVLILNHEANRLEGVKKALTLLSRALEANQTSEILWIVYLLIYYSNTNSIGKDDMFSYAVKSNGGSYILWLMFINSRIGLDDRLVAYDAALDALCRCASVYDGDELHASACILDLFLQMIDFLRMSGNTEKAIQRISGLFLDASDSDESYSMLLSDILRCITISDKLIFWVCCLYLVIYGKLPDSVVHQFEWGKDLLEINWPSVELEDNEKLRALKLMETAIDSVESYTNSEFVKSEINLRSSQLFAVCHIRCMAALDGLDCMRKLLDKYIKLYPSCLELVLLSARLQKHDLGNLSFVGFEEALVKWPAEVPGYQCIWNQYAEFALQNRRPRFAEELMDRWFHTVWKVRNPQGVTLDTMDSDTTCGSLELTLASNPENSASNKGQKDLIFGLLNLSLMKLLQKDHSEAWSAIDRALKSVAAEDFKHCVREHAIFLLTDESGKNEDGTTISNLLNLLTGYLEKAHSFPQSEPISRLFINSVDKPRVRQLITSLLSPISFGSSLVNMVLEVWFGPSLLPPKFSKLGDLVDFVEVIMNVVPSNYQLAFSVIKMLGNGFNPNDFTPTSALFWASSLLVGAIFHAVPVAPEYVWVEAAGVLGNIAGIASITERFYKRALLVYPFSVSLWKCYYDQSKSKGDTALVVEAAKQKGLRL